MTTLVDREHLELKVHKFPECVETILELVNGHSIHEGLRKSVPVVD